MDEAPDSGRPHPTLTRRTFLAGAGGVAAGGILGQELTARPQGPAVVEELAGEVELVLSINGEERTLTAEPRTTLLSALRDRLHLTGAKLVCDRGNCGACTVLLDGAPAYSCLTLAVDARGRAVRTVEGLARGGELSPVQQAMWEHDGQMCGFCTPGFVMSLTACLERDPRASEDELRAACAGNLCRCGTYPHVFAAGLAAGRRMQEGR